MLKVHRQGDWFLPCGDHDAVCWNQFNRGKAAGLWDMKGLVGVHRSTGKSSP